MNKIKSISILILFVVVCFFSLYTISFADSTATDDTEISTSEGSLNEALSDRTQTGQNTIKDAVAAAVAKEIMSTEDFTEGVDLRPVDSPQYTGIKGIEQGYSFSISEGTRPLPGLVNFSGTIDGIVKFVSTQNLTMEQAAQKEAERYEALGIEGERLWSDEFIHTTLYTQEGNMHVDLNCQFIIENGVLVGVNGEFPEGFDPTTLYMAYAVEIEGYLSMLTGLNKFYMAGGEYDPTGDGLTSDTTDFDEGYRWGKLNESYTLYQHMVPERSGSISNPGYNVEEAIPTSENLDFSASADDVIYDIAQRTYNASVGVRDITIKINANYKYMERYDTGKKWYNPETKKREPKYDWREAIGTISYIATTSHSDEHKEIFYDVPKSDIHPLSNAIISGAPTDGSVSIPITGDGIKAAAQTIDVNVDEPNVNQVEEYHVGLYDSRAEAEVAIQSKDAVDTVKKSINNRLKAAITVTNTCNYSYRDLVVKNKSTSGTTPYVESKSGGATRVIPSTKENGNYATSGTVNYADGHSFGFGVNDVFVHTPVVNNASITEVSDFVNQKVPEKIDPNRTYLRLDETFTITIPDSGTHISKKGYGYQDSYNSYRGVNNLETTWGKLKDVKFPFDVYLHVGNELKIVKANTWLSDLGYTNAGKKCTFTIPVWAEEGEHDIITRVVAENADASKYGATEENANLNPDNYVAIKTIPVEVIGKIYDLRISASDDPGWSSIYSWDKKTNYITAEEFPFGAKGQNKNVAYKYAPKLGYTFVFDFKTKGTKSNNIDINVKPDGFYFVSRDGKTTTEVDLYYNTTTTPNVKIGLSDNNKNLFVKLRDAFMKVASQEFVDSTRIYGNKYNYGVSVYTGTFAKMNLPHSLRLCYNNFAEYVAKLYGINSTEASISNDAGGRDVVIGSVGHWYAGYRLPASTKVVKKGANINTAIKNKELLTDGYIIVKFDIKTKYNEYDYLLYKGPEAKNEGGNPNNLVLDWNAPGLRQNITLPNGINVDIPAGLIAIYDASLRSSNDAEVGGTH